MYNYKEKLMYLGTFWPHDFKIFVFMTHQKTCPCNVYPIIPHFYIVKLGYAGVYLFFLFLLQNIDCGYSLEPPQNNLCFEQK